MPKNGQNDLKFLHKMSYDHFYSSWKFCQNLSKMLIFWQKKSSFFIFYAAIPEKAGTVQDYPTVYYFCLAKLYGSRVILAQTMV